MSAAVRWNLIHANPCERVVPPKCVISQKYIYDQATLGLFLTALEDEPVKHRLWIMLALSGGLLIFGATAVAGGSGYLAAYFAGLVLGSRRLQGADNIRRFHEYQRRSGYIHDDGDGVRLSKRVLPLQSASRVNPVLPASHVRPAASRPVPNSSNNSSSNKASALWQVP